MNQKPGLAEPGSQAHVTSALKRNKIQLSKKTEAQMYTYFRKKTKKRKNAISMI